MSPDSLFCTSCSTTLAGIKLKASTIKMVTTIIHVNISRTPIILKREKIINPVRPDIPTRIINRLALNVKVRMATGIKVEKTKAEMPTII